MKTTQSRTALQKNFPGLFAATTVNVGGPNSTLTLVEQLHKAGMTGAAWQVEKLISESTAHDLDGVETSAEELQDALASEAEDRALCRKEKWQLAEALREVLKMAEALQNAIPDEDYEKETLDLESAIGEAQRVLGEQS